MSSVLTPFALGTAVGAIALGRVPVGNAAGNLVTSWLNPGPVLIGVLAVAFSGYLAAVYLAADALRYSDQSVAASFQRRALAAGLVSGALALAGLLVMRGSGLDLTHGPALTLVAVSGVAGLSTLALCWRFRFGLARLTAALAVAAVVAGWAAAQAPQLLPAMTVTQAAAGRSTLVALTIGVCCGSIVLIPSLALLFTLFLRGRLDTPEHHAATVTRFPGGAPAPAGATSSAQSVSPAGNSAPVRGSPAPARPSPAGPLAHRARAWATAALAGLIAGAGLLVFANPAWLHGIGVACLVLCAVSVFTLAAPPSRQD